MRLIRIVPALNELARGVLDACQGLFWVMCFMLLLIYAIAILVTRLIGHFDATSMPDPRQVAEVQEVQKMFRDVKTSMFYLFETMSSWTLVPLIPLFQIAPITRLIFVVFYIFAGWTLLAVMTGVVSFNMIALRAQITREDEARDQASKEKAKEVLLEIFEYADYDRSGELSIEEFEEMMKNEDIVKSIETNTNIKKQDLEDLWHWLDDDGSETVSWDEFLRGFQWLNEPFRPKTLLRLQEKVVKELRGTKRCFLDLIASTFDSIMIHVQPPMLKMHAITEQVQLLGIACDSVQKGLMRASSEAAACQQMKASGHPDSSVYTLEHFERNFSSQIDQVLERLDRFRPKLAHHQRAFDKQAAWEPQDQVKPSPGFTRDPLMFDPSKHSRADDLDETGSQHTDPEHYEKHADVRGRGSIEVGGQSDNTLLIR